MYKNSDKLASRRSGDQEKQFGDETASGQAETAAAG
jgi:hypothetical protein